MNNGFSEHFVNDGSDYSVEKGAVLIVDMLNDFCKEGGLMVLKEGAEIIEPIKELIATARKKNLLIIYINDCHRADKTDKEFLKRSPHCIDGTWGAVVIDELKPMEHDFCIKKRRFSGFYQTDLDQVLRDYGIENLIVTGVVTNICVRSTCHDAFFRNYGVIVPEDCVRATGQREQESTLWDIETHFGSVTTSDMVKKKIENLA